MSYRPWRGEVKDANGVVLDGSARVAVLDAMQAASFKSGVNVVSATVHRVLSKMARENNLAGHVPLVSMVLDIINNPVQPNQPAVYTSVNYLDVEKTFIVGFLDGAKLSGATAPFFDPFCLQRLKIVTR